MSLAPIALDCNACKAQSTMVATRIPRFNTIIRVIGVIILIPSILGVVIALITAVTASRVSAGAGAIGVGVALIFGSVSLVAGLVGWLLLMKRNVYKCERCGFILDRA